MLHASMLLALLLSQSVAHIQAAKSPVVEALSQAATQLPSLAEVDLAGEIQKALRAPAPSSPLRAH